MAVQNRMAQRHHRRNLATVGKQIRYNNVTLSAASHPAPQWHAESTLACFPSSGTELWQPFR